MHPKSHESLEDAVQQSLDEARMVLPGLQALFGFQLIAVFSERFDIDLDSTEQMLHLGAIALIGVAMALIMTPAAYHRQTNPSDVSQRLLKVASSTVSAALVPLMAGVCLDMYLVARLVTGRVVVSAVFALVLMAIFAALWFAYPNWERRRTWRAKQRSALA